MQTGLCVTSLLAHWPRDVTSVLLPLTKHRTPAELSSWEVICYEVLWLPKACFHSELRSCPQLMCLPGAAAENTKRGTAVRKETTRKKILLRLQPYCYILAGGYLCSMSAGVSIHSFCHWLQSLHIGITPDDAHRVKFLFSAALQPWSRAWMPLPHPSNEDVPQISARSTSKPKQGRCSPLKAALAVFHSTTQWRGLWKNSAVTGPNQALSSEKYHNW